MAGNSDEKWETMISQTKEQQQELMAMYINRDPELPQMIKELLLSTQHIQKITKEYDKRTQAVFEAGVTHGILTLCVRLLTHETRRATAMKRLNMIPAHLREPARRMMAATQQPMTVTEDEPLCQEELEALEYLVAFGLVYEYDYGFKKVFVLTDAGSLVTKTGNTEYSAEREKGIDHGDL